MLILAALAALLLALATVPAGPGQAQLAPADSARFVRVETVQMESGRQSLRLPGLLRAADSAELAFLHAGHLAERRVRRGEQVSSGQVLALLHNPALSPALSAGEARLREVRTELEQADRELNRIEDLHRRSLLSTEELERARARRSALVEAVEQAEARRREASEQLAEASLRAPFAGTVVDFYAESGEFVAAGQPVLALAGSGKLEVALEIGARRAAELRVGQSLRVSEHAGGLSVEAILVEAGLAGTGRPAPLRLALTEIPEHWQPGLGVLVELEFPNPGGISVPLAAVIDPGGRQPRVFRIENGQASAVSVRLGPISAGRVQVEGNLELGDSVIVAGHGQLLDGESVRVLP